MRVGEWVRELESERMNVDFHSFVLIIGSVCFVMKARDLKAYKGESADCDFGPQKSSTLSGH